MILGGLTKFAQCPHALLVVSGSQTHGPWEVLDINSDVINNIVLDIVRGGGGGLFWPLGPV